MQPGLCPEPLTNKFCLETCLSKSASALVGLVFGFHSKRRPWVQSTAALGTLWWMKQTLKEDSIHWPVLKTVPTLTASMNSHRHRLCFHFNQAAFLHLWSSGPVIQTCYKKDALWNMNIHFIYRFPAERSLWVPGDLRSWHITQILC